MTTCIRQQFLVVFFFELVLIFLIPTPGYTTGQTDQTAPPQLRIVGGTSDEDLGNFKTDSMLFQHNFTLESVNEVIVPSAKLEVVLLSGPGGATTKTTKPKLKGPDGSSKLEPVNGKSKHRISFSTKLPKPGHYRFGLTLLTSDRRSYRFQVERQAPDLKIVEAQGETLTLTTDSMNFRRPLHLQTNGPASAEEVKITLSGLIGPDGTSVPVKEPTKDNDRTWDRIEGHRSVSFVLQADLAETGAYRGTLEITYLGGLKSYPITITKSLKGANVLAIFAGAGQATIPSLDEATVALHVLLRENGGKSLELKEPTLEGLTRKIGDTTELSASYSGTKFFATDKKQIVSWPLLSPGGVEDLRVEIEGLTKPGLYSGKFLVSAVDRSPIDVPISFYLRRSIYWAGLAIFIGIALSWALRLWATTLRPRMVQLRKVLAVVKDVDAAMETIQPARPEETEVLTAMRGLLAQAYDNLRDGTSNSANHLIDSINLKLSLLPDWIKLNRQIAELELEERAYSLRQELDSVRDYLMRTNPETSDTAAATLKGLPAKIRTLLKELFENFEAQIFGLGESILERGRHDRWANEVLEPVSAAKTALNTDNATAASANIEAARLAAGKILADDLQEKLPSQGHAPEWLTHGRFERIQILLSESKDAVDAHTAVGAFRKALGLYLEPFARDLKTKIEVLVTNLKLQASGDQGILEAISSLTESQAKLSDVHQMVQSGNLSDASLACNTAETMYNQHLDSGSGPAVELMRARATHQQVTKQAPTGEDVPNVTVALPVPDLPITFQGLAATDSSISGMITTFDLLYQMIVAFIAVALGLYVLWAGNLDWGSESDILIAILWGLGLQSLTTGANAYQGLTDLGAKFR